MSLNRSFLVERPTFREDPSSRRRKNYREEYQREKEKKRLLLFTFEKRTFDKEEFEKGEGGGKIELANRGGGRKKGREEKAEYVEWNRRCFSAGVILGN